MPVEAGAEFRIVFVSGRRACLHHDIHRRQVLAFTPELSRTVRLMRVRSTDRATAFLATARPSRGVCAALAQANTTKQVSLLRVPSRNTWLNSEGRSRRTARGRKRDAWSRRQVLYADGEALAALGPPRVQHLTAALGRHTCPETVSACTADLARLIGSFHDCSPLKQMGPGAENPGQRRDIRRVARAAVNSGMRRAWLRQRWITPWRGYRLPPVFELRPLRPQNP